MVPEKPPHDPFPYDPALIDNMEVGHGSGESKKEAEQQAAYSVSQSFSDETCAALLDKVDRLRLGGESR